jgi:hypothetical protein
MIPKLYTFFREIRYPNNYSFIHSYSYGRDDEIDHFWILCVKGKEEFKTGCDEGYFTNFNETDQSNIPDDIKQRFIKSCFRNNLFAD